ncbi:MAG: hypothetical protein FWG90_03670 [Oscillospiraceae bacterium]|nr:hypothetical protein [Oscillospiraceae bacterium]
MFRPYGRNEMTTAARLLKRSLVTELGINKPVYTAAEKEPILMCNFKTFVGGEEVSKGLFAESGGAKITCFYRPDIAHGDRLELLSKDGETVISSWDIVTPPDNIEQRDFWLQFNVRLVT